MLNQTSIFFRHIVTDSIGNVESSCSSFNDFTKDMAQKVSIWPSSIFWRKLNLSTQRLCKSNCCNCALDTLITVNLEFVLKVDIRGCQESVNALVRRGFKSFGASLNIARCSSCKTSNNLRNEKVHCSLITPLFIPYYWFCDYTYHGLANAFTALHQRSNFLGNAIDCLKVSNWSNRETGFQNINTQLGELDGNSNFFVVVETNTGGLWWKSFCSFSIKVERSDRYIWWH